MKKKDFDEYINDPELIEISEEIYRFAGCFRR